jgi:hypothetical protein
MHLDYKPSKRNINKSEENLRMLEDSHQMNSHNKLNGIQNYVFIDNSDLTSEQTADYIINSFIFLPPTMEQ